jgi:uncharacterized protein YbjQ (UPF0145 family)
VLSTTDELPGQVVEEVLGLVIGGAPDAQRAFAQLQEVADELGATAVIGVRLAITATGGIVFSSQEAVAYGTAVVTRPADSR